MCFNYFEKYMWNTYKVNKIYYKFIRHVKNIWNIKIMNGMYKLNITFFFRERMLGGWDSPLLGVNLGMHTRGVVRVGDVVYTQWCKIKILLYQFFLPWLFYQLRKRTVKKKVILFIYFLLGSQLLRAFIISPPLCWESWASGDSQCDFFSSLTSKCSFLYSIENYIMYSILKYDKSSCEPLLNLSIQ